MTWINGEPRALYATLRSNKFVEVKVDQGLATSFDSVWDRPVFGAKWISEQAAADVQAKYPQAKISRSTMHNSGFCWALHANLENEIRNYIDQNW